MKGLAPLFLGIFGVRLFVAQIDRYSNWQSASHQSDEEGTTFIRPQSGMFERGAHVYADGCIYCHSSSPRDYAAPTSNENGEIVAAPRDYIFEQPVFLGKCAWAGTS
jgi:cbb3-type cytochrome oxidase cytochrome c subunit